MFKAVFGLMFGSLASKVLGLLREVLFAAWFGTTEIAAAYRIAQSLIFIFIHSIVGDTLAGTMLPLYQKLRAESEDKGRLLLAVALGQGLLIGLVIGTCMFFFAEHVVNILAPGASVAARSLASTMVRIMAIVAPVYIVGNTLAYIETAYGKYTTLSSRTSLANFGIILAGGLAFFFKNPLLIAIGFVGVYVSFLAFTAFDFYKSGLSTNIFGKIAKPVLPIAILFEKNVFSLLGILLIGQGNVFAERVVASWLGTSVIPGLDYARFLTDTVNVMLAVPLGIITMASHGASTIEALKAHAGKVSRFLLVLTIPVSVLFLTGARDIVSIVYQHGKFDSHSVEITAAILQGASIGLFATVTAYFLIKSMNTALRNKESLFFTVISVAANIAFNLLAWRHLGPLTLGIGNSICGIVLLVGTVTYLKLWRAVGPVLAQGLGAGIFITLLLTFIPLHFMPLVNMIARGLLIAGTWAGLYFASKQTREVANPLVVKISDVLRKSLANKRAT